jgi:hypothetical protein
VDGSLEDADVHRSVFKLRGGKTEENRVRRLDRFRGIDHEP